MRISKEQYYKDMARALLRGYFAGVKEGKEKGCNKIDKGVKSLHNTKGCCLAKIE